MNKIKNIYYMLLLGLIIPTKFAFGQDTGVIYQPLPDNSGVGIRNPIVGVGSIPDLITLILRAFVAIGTPIAVLFLIFGGFKYVMAKGNPNKISEANEYLMWTIVGIVVLLGAEILSVIIRNTILQLGAGVI